MIPLLSVCACQGREIGGKWLLLWEENDSDMKYDITYTLDRLPEVAEELLEKFGDHRVWAFDAPMGAGKTTLIRAVCDRLGVTDTVTSPTFAIVNEYRGDGTPPVYHFDFYRIDRIEEAFDFGYEEDFFSGNLCLGEWPEKIESLLPDDAMNVRIDVPDEDERVISID